MKAIKNKDGNYSITKGKITFEIISGTDRYPYLPTRIKYEDTIYPLKIGLIDTINVFKECYSEEQVLEKLLELI